MKATITSKEVVDLLRSHYRTLHNMDLKLISKLPKEIKLEVSGLSTGGGASNLQQKEKKGR